MATTGEGDVALSIEETNKLRASLGLKPLSLEPPKQQQRAERKAPAEELKPDADAIRAKLAEARDKRRREQELQQTRGLGEAGGDADDAATWVVKMRQQPQQPPAKRQQREVGGDRRGRQRRSGDGGGGDDEERDASASAAELAGARVRHDADELAEGETMVLTLADAPILDAAGGLNDAGDELEEVARAQDKARAKARRAAGKEAKPLWAEDGNVRSLLDKYDEEDEEAGFVLDAAGAAAAAAARQDKVRERLAAAAAALDAVAAPAMGGAVDYMTAEEAAASAGGGLKKKKKKRKLRTTRAAADEDTADGGGSAGGGEGGLDLDALEAAAKAEGGGDLGSREARQQRREALEAAAAADAADRAARFQRAVERTNWASEALRAPGPVGDEEDEAEAELAESLSRVRRLAQRSSSTAVPGGDSNGSGRPAPESVEEIAQRLGKKRAEDEERLRDELAAGGSDLFSAATEFVRNIGGAGDDNEGEQQRGGGGGGGGDAPYMDVEMEEAGQGRGQGQTEEEAQQNGNAGDAGGDGTTSTGAGIGAATAKGRNYRKRSGWVSAEDEDAQQAGGEQHQQQQQQQQLLHKQQGRSAETTSGVSAVAGERVIGRGLAGALGMLQDTGALKGPADWAGRTNEKKAVALIGLEDVYTGGKHEDRMARSIEAALTQRDEFGRVMTPKERFRKLCHQFHGIAPSKNTEAHRQRKYLEDVAIKRATTSADPSAELDRIRVLTQQLGTPYLPLDGKAALPGRGGDDDDGPALPVARGAKGGGKPQLGGGLTPLVGDRKVEAMLGLKKPPQPAGGRGGAAGGGGATGGRGSGGMPPPRARGKP